MGKEARDGAQIDVCVRCVQARSEIRVAGKEQLSLPFEIAVGAIDWLDKRSRASQELIESRSLELGSVCRAGSFSDFLDARHCVLVPARRVPVAHKEQREDATSLRAGEPCQSPLVWWTRGKKQRTPGE